MSARRVLAAAGLAALMSCRPDAAPPVVTPTPAAPAAEPLAEARAAWLSVTGTGETAEAAEAQARAELATRLVGDPRWLALYPVDLHGQPGDPMGVEDDGQGHATVALGLSRARVVAVMSDLEATKPRLQGPDAWRELQYAFVSAQAAVHLCTRRQALFEAECDAGDTSESDAALAALVASVALVPDQPGGVPVDVDSRVLNDPGVYVMWNGVPTAGVPVVVVTDGGEPQTRTSDAGGRVSLGVAPGHAMPDSLRARIDTEALLGPLAAAWRAETLAIAPRPLALTRWALVHQGGAAGAAKLRAALARGGLGPAAAIDARRATEIAKASAGERTAALTAVARDARGTLDYVVVAVVRAAFASRMGGDRVWYEASGSLELLETWSGRAVARVDSKVKASGVGDAKAEAAARAKLFDALTTALREDERVPWPRG